MSTELPSKSAEERALKQLLAVTGVSRANAPTTELSLERLLNAATRKTKTEFHDAIGHACNNSTMPTSATTMMSGARVDFRKLFAERYCSLTSAALFDRPREDNPRLFLVLKLKRPAAETLTHWVKEHGLLWSLPKLQQDYPLKKDGKPMEEGNIRRLQNLLPWLRAHKMEETEYLLGATNPIPGYSKSDRRNNGMAFFDFVSKHVAIKDFFSPKSSVTVTWGQLECLRRLEASWAVRPSSGEGDDARMVENVDQIHTILIPEPSKITLHHYADKLAGISISMTPPTSHSASSDKDSRLDDQRPGGDYKKRKRHVPGAARTRPYVGKQEAPAHKKAKKERSPTGKGKSASSTIGTALVLAASLLLLSVWTGASPLVVFGMCALSTLLAWSWWQSRRDTSMSSLSLSDESDDEPLGMETLVQDPGLIDIEAPAAPPEPSTLGRATIRASTHPSRIDRPRSAVSSPVRRPLDSHNVMTESGEELQFPKIQ